MLATLNNSGVRARCTTRARYSKVLPKYICLARGLLIISS